MFFFFFKCNLTLAYWAATRKVNIFHLAKNQLSSFLYLFLPSNNFLFFRINFSQFLVFGNRGDLAAILIPTNIFVVFSIFVEVWLIYNVVLISAVHQSDSDIYIYTLFFVFFSIMVYPRRLDRVPCDTQ